MENVPVVEFDNVTGVPIGLEAPLSVGTPPASDSQPAGSVPPAIPDPTPAAPATDPAPETPPAKIDLSTLPEFQKYQSEQDKKMAEMMALTQNTQQQLSQAQTQYEQQLADANARLAEADAARAQTMPIEQQAEFWKQQAEKQRALTAQVRQEQEIDRRKRETLQYLSQTYEVPRADIPDQSFEITAKAVMDNLHARATAAEKRLADQAEELKRYKGGKDEAESLDGGSGSSPAPSNVWQKKYEDGVRSMMAGTITPEDVDNIVGEANLAGVEIDLEAAMRISMGV